MKAQAFKTSILRAARLLSILLLAGLAGAARAAAQSSTEPVAPELWHSRLEIGPVAGLTTAFHPAPVRTAIPLGVTVQLRIKAPFSSTVVWTGAREIDRNPGGSTAEVKFDSLGSRIVSVVTDDPYEGHLEETSVFDVINTTPATIGFDPINLSALRVTADAIVIDPLKANASSLGFFFRSSSIAALRKVGEDHFRTSINRSLLLEAVIQPSAIAPLVEWRLDGIPQRHLGSPVRLEIYTTGPHTLSAGPLGAEKSVQIDTYRVRITSHQPGDDIPEGLLVTFTAETDPPGFESDITWLASTKFGTAQPWTATGPQFTVAFHNSVGASGRWIGVRADNAVLGFDRNDPIDLQSGSLTGHVAEAKALCTLLKPNTPQGGEAGQDLLTGVVLGFCGGSQGPLAAICDPVGCACDIFQPLDSQTGCGDFLQECEDRDFPKYRCSSDGLCTCLIFDRPPAPGPA